MERFERYVEVGAPVERVFDLLSDFEGYPRWMENVRGVWRAGRRVMHWVVGTAIGIDVEWDAEVTVFRPDRRIVWRAFRGDVRADGEFVLAETPEGATLVRFVLGYDTPGGRTGARAARFFGRHPGQQLGEDLARFRRLAERGGRRARRTREDEARRAEEEHRRRVRAGWYLRRGVDRLLGEPPPG